MYSDTSTPQLHAHTNARTARHAHTPNTFATAMCPHIRNCDVSVSEYITAHSHDLQYNCRSKYNCAYHRCFSVSSMIYEVVISSVLQIVLQIATMNDDVSRPKTHRSCAHVSTSQLRIRCMYVPLSRCVRLYLAQRLTLTAHKGLEQGVVVWQ